MSVKKLIQEAQEAREQGNYHQALQACDKASHISDAGRYQAALLRGQMMLDLNDAPAALSAFESIATLEKEDGMLDFWRGMALFAMTQFPEATAALHSALRSFEHLADAYFALGIMAEIEGSGRESEYFREARRLNPTLYPAASHWPIDKLPETLSSVIEQLPPELTEQLVDIPVIVTTVPTLEQLRALTPPAHPTSVGFIVPWPESSFAAHYPEQSVMLLCIRNAQRAAAQHQQTPHALLTQFFTEQLADSEQEPSIFDK